MPFIPWIAFGEAIINPGLNNGMYHQHIANCPWINGALKFAYNNGHNKIYPGIMPIDYGN
jgi:hypothetical protein